MPGSLDNRNKNAERDGVPCPSPNYGGAPARQTRRGIEPRPILKKLQENLQKTEIKNYLMGIPNRYSFSGHEGFSAVNSRLNETLRDTESINKRLNYLGKRPIIKVSISGQLFLNNFDEIRRVHISILVRRRRRRRRRSRRRWYNSRRGYNRRRR